MHRLTGLVRYGFVVAVLFFLAPLCVGQVITCSSDDMHRNFCAADTRGGVQLVKQRSGSECRQGYSWGYDGRGIWVDHGCRADFQLSNGRDDNRGWDAGGNVITCSSDDMHRQFCPADTRGDVRLVKQRSGSECRQGYSWGYDRKGIWVDHGCRADFEVSRRRGGRPDWNDHDRDGDRNQGTGGALISCNSDDMKRHYCSVDTRGGVTLVKQHSEAACRQGSSWGYDRNGIWVDHGCRADFQTGR